MRIRKRLFSKKLFNKLPVAWPVLLALVVVGSSIVYRHTMDTPINPAAYAPLLDTIAKGESNGNYNAYYGNATNNDIRFTTMPVSDVLAWQDEYVKQGSYSSAVGKYQIIRPTLAGLVQQLSIDPTTRFDEALQDKMAIALLERRGAQEFIDNKLSRAQYAANLAQEWAALPKASGAEPHQSYYASDGVNKAHISISDVYDALAALQNQAGKPKNNEPT
jgi:muramidase (phage lysozyme)